MWMTAKGEFFRRAMLREQLMPHLGPWPKDVLDLAKVCVRACVKLKPPPIFALHDALVEDGRHPLFAEAVLVEKDFRNMVQYGCVPAFLFEWRETRDKEIQALLIRRARERCIYVWDFEEEFEP